MASYSDTVRDQYNRPVAGAFVYIYTQAGVLAVLRTSSGGALANPVKTDASGIYGFDADDAKYRREIRLGALSLDTSDIIVGDPPEYTGATGPANSTYTTLTALKAAAVTNASYIFAPPSGSDGGAAAGTFLYQTAGAPYTADGVNVVKLDAVPLSAGALVRQGAQSILFQQAGSSAKPRTAQDKARETVSVLDFGAKGDGTTNDTAAFNAAIATGKRVVVPYTPAGYSVAGINVRAGMHVAGEKIGDSEATPKLIVREAGKAAFFNAAATNVANVTFENLACEAGPGILDARFYDQATDTFYSAYFTFRQIETYLSLSIGYKGLFIFALWDGVRDGYYGSPTNTSHIAIQALAGSYGQTNRQNINRITAGKFFSSYGGQGAIVASYGTKWVIDGATDFEALKTAAFRGYNTTQVEFEGAWFEGIEATAIVAFSDLGGDFCSATFSRCTFVLTNPTPQFAVTIESGTIAFRTCVFNLVPAGMRQINNGARITVNDGCIVDGAGAANFMDGAFADMALGGRRRLNGARDSGFSGITLQNGGGLSATGGFLSADNISVGTSFVTIATSLTGLGGHCVVSAFDPATGQQLRQTVEWVGTTFQTVGTPINNTGKTVTFQSTTTTLQMKVDAGSIVAFTTLLN